MSERKTMVNADKPGRWNADTRESVLMYNSWFMDFAPKAFQAARGGCLRRVEEFFSSSENAKRVTLALLASDPQLLTVLRMMCAPPIAKDRLAGLSGVPRSRVVSMEEGRLPARERDSFIAEGIPALLGVVSRLFDRQLISWLDGKREPSGADLTIAQSVIADRLSGSASDPIIRNAQEERQLAAIGNFLDRRSYSYHGDSSVGVFDMPRGTYSFHRNVRVYKNAVDGADGYVNVPIDVAIMPHDPSTSLPVLVECKSAGDFANTNKRRKEEDAKVTRLRATYGEDVILYLFLCGYFESTYLGYEAANHMDWVWEHRISDFEEAGV